MRAKFIRGKDPKTAMGIGMLWIRKDFNNWEDLVDYAVGIIPAILGVDKLPKDLFIMPSQLYQSWKYYNPLDKYFGHYVFFKDRSVDWNNILKDVRDKILGRETSEYDPELDKEDMKPGSPNEFINLDRWPEWIKNERDSDERPFINVKL